MTQRSVVFWVAMACAMPALAAKVYQWRDADGRVYYSDQPPPAVAAKERQIRANTIGNASPVASKPQIATDPEITLWVSAGCEPACSNALAMLDQRNVPYEVRNVNPADEKSMLAFINAVGSLQARPPVLIIGKTVLKEWNSPLWQAELSRAGYPLNQRKK
jgi:hypothetical protein